jgi:ABC-type nitrate/sulfonate/bicarbonate transport system substrate-binding protein
MRIRGGGSLALMITAVALALAAGCSSHGAAAGAGAPRPEKTDLNVAVVPALDSAGFFVALYGGLFKAQVTDLSGLVGKTIAINAPKNILYLLAASVLAEHGIKPSLVHFASVPFPNMTAALQSSAVGAALLPEPFASGAEEARGVVPLADLNQGATTAFPIAGYVVTKKWAARYPRTLAAFYTAIEQGQQLADINRSDVEGAMMDIPAPFGVSRQTAAVLALDSYPFSPGPVGSVDKVRLQRVVNVMQQFIGFPKFNIDTMIMPHA